MEKAKQKIALSYIAGCFDSDGSFSILRSFTRNKRNNKKTVTWSPWIQIAQIDSKAINFIKHHLQYYNSYSTQIKNGGRKFYRLIFCNKKAYLVARQLIPYLKIKQEQAKVLLKLEPMLNQRPKIKIKCKKTNKYGTFDSIGYRVSKSQIKERDNLIKRVRILNGTWNRRKTS